ncbi:DNA repair ATPase [Streptomyces sp. NPDC047315]|uniref:DNA repair ATPase n=1 Tax=Streptomyces sp. NPDC047315 TaxID=3155142 RepID=UPI0033FEAA58
METDTGSGSGGLGEHGEYGVLRARLRRGARELQRRADALNSSRTTAFGAAELQLARTVQLRTTAPALPRDAVAIGGALLLACDPPAALSPDTAVGDVFALYDRELNPLAPDAVPGLLDDPAFLAEFAALCRYFRGARLERLRVTGGRLLAVFRTGEKDVRVLRWSLAPRAFLDARGERDLAEAPPAQDVTWTETTRDDHAPGRHPHVRVTDGVFVAATGGALTVKTVDDTESPGGVHSEPVDDPSQALADAEVAWARVGTLVLLRVRPYNEDVVRHLVVDTLTATVVRLDGIGESCRRLPDDQGIVFPGGYCLTNGTVRTFETSDATGGPMEFERTVQSPGGENVLYAFRNGAGCRLLPYDTIRETVAAPLTCDAYALFDDGLLLALHGAEEPSRVHRVRLWRSPYVSDAHPAPDGGGPLARIGNADLVRGVADAFALARRAAAVGDAEGTATVELYEALVADCERTADRHPWLGDAEVGDLRAPLTEVRETAERALEEFATVRALTRSAAEALAEAAATVARLVRRVRGEAPASAEEWIARIAELRAARGRLVTLKELRYADVAAIDALAEDVEADTASAARRAVAFLQRAEAFAGYAAEVAALADRAAALTTAAEADEIVARLDERAAGLATLTEVVTGLEVADATVRTGILERVAGVVGAVNRARATLVGRRRELAEQEGRAEFAAEFALLAQSVTGALAAAATPEECDAQLARLLLHLEDLESRFADHDGFLAQIAERRSEVYEAFSARRQALQDDRARRAERLAQSAGRALEAVARRAAALPDADAVHTYFGSDPMVARILRTADELRALGDSVRAEELAGRLKAARQEAGRALRDRRELFADGGDTIRLGRHRFAVTAQEPELTLVPRGDGMVFALTGTDFRAPVEGAEFAAARPYWTRSLPSESPDVYRAEYLAARLLPAAVAGGDPAELVARAVADAYDEGYERGVHDHDAQELLRAVLGLWRTAGLLRFPGGERARAQLFWSGLADGAVRERWARQARSLVAARERFGPSPALAALHAELTDAVGSSVAAEYLVEELATGGSFATSGAARALLAGFHEAVDESYDVRDVLDALGPAEARRLVEGWLGAYAATDADSDVVAAEPDVVAEAVALELCPKLERYDVAAGQVVTVTGLLGDHPRVRRGSLTVRLDEFLTRTADFAAREVPGFRAYQKLRTALVAAERERLRLAEHRPRVMTAFVRNRLVDEVYLPLVGDSLARQIGAAGDDKRTDSGGLLLLLSPPGYGKTTLVEYVAQRLGLLLVKVDGPALGRDTVSLDPAQAPDAAARAELAKVEFALAAGNNVLLYLDDIQHTSPELLQRFIPLCDASRRLGGRDLRGKRFAVCMAGNPYTESGERFRLPDMLANRADVWDLGDVLTGREEAFELSFVENALTSHPLLAPLAGRERGDVELLVRLAAGDAGADRGGLVHPYEPGELAQVVDLLRHVLAARRTVLAVNAAYIASAGVSQEARTEPPFRLQGSYRDMNRIVQRLSPAMDAAELAAVVTDHYTAEARALPGDTEANVLKLAELRGALDGPDAARWAAVKEAYGRTRARERDPFGELAERIAAVEAAIVRATERSVPVLRDPGA